jgi:multiple sugar transport system permease protein
MKKDENITGLAFLSPNIFGFLVFTFLPVLAAFTLSLYHWDIFHAPKFIGIQNYFDLLGWVSGGDTFKWVDPDFWKYLGNTVFYLMAIPLSMAASLFLAIVLNQKIRGRIFFRTVFFLPTISASVGLLLLWKYLYNGDYGLFNFLLSKIGIEGPGWLTDYHWAKPSIMIMMIWGSMGGVAMVIYLAGLQNIPQELYEAAQIDGANAWNKFCHITWPMLAPTTFFIFVTSIIGGFQSGFDAAYILTEGGPAGATTTLDYYIYNHAFVYFNMGYAATIAVVLFFIVFVVTMINWRFGGRTTQYA